MSITLDNKAVDAFKLYDEMVAAYSKDIEGYKTLLKAIVAMIAQKEETLRDIKDKTVDLLKSSLEITTTQKIPVRKKGKKFNYAGVDEKALATGKDVKSEETVEVKSLVVIPPKKEQVKRTRSANRKKTAGKDKAKRADKSNEPNKRPEKNAETKPPGIKKSEKPAKAEKEIKCLYHPESAAVDMQRQLCSSCRWKLRSNGLTEYDKDPAVIAFLKGETKSIPNLGQPMCPVHPEVPAYNKKTGLCQRCQSKAKAMGIVDRHPTEKELKVLRPA